MTDISPAVVVAWRGTAEGPTVPWRTRRRRFVSAVVVLTVALGILSGLAGALLARSRGPQHAHHPGPPAWAQVVGGFLFLASAAVLVRAFLRARSQGQLRPYGRSPLWALTRAERARAGRQLRGREAFGPDQVPLLRLLATDATRATWFRSGLPALVGLQLAQVFLHWGQRFAWLFVVTTVGLALTTPLLRRQSAVARRFLDGHPAGAAAPPR